MREYLKPNVVLHTYAKTDVIMASGIGSNDSNGDGGKWSNVVPLE